MGLRRFYRIIRQDLYDAALSLRLLPETRDYTRFIILSVGRSGSNYLASSLRSHENIVAYGEIFNKANHDRILWEYRGQNYTPRQLALRARDPVAFIDSIVFRPMPGRTRAVGFKLFYYHAKGDDRQAVWLHLRDMNIRIIHLKRRNLLAHQLSMSLAHETREWSTREGTGQGAHHKCTLSYEDCLTGFEAVTRWQEDADQFFSDQDRLEVWYEDLQTDYAAHMERIQNFLGVTPRPMSSPLKKQSALPLSQAIGNYAELKARFAGSRWASFFD